MYNFIPHKEKLILKENRDGLTVLTAKACFNTSCHQNYHILKILHILSQ